MSEVPLKRARLRAYINALADIVEACDTGVSVDRAAAVEALRRSLEEVRAEPFRGVRYSEDVYEKELTSLYIVATRILRLPPGRFRGGFERLFSYESRLSMVANVIKRRSDPGEIREAVERYLGAADEATLSKLIRYIATEYYLDLIPEGDAVRAVANLVKAYPELSEGFKRIVKFFIAVVAGGKIASGEVRSRMDLEMFKKALSINLNLRGWAPSNGYIVEVARIVYGDSVRTRKLSGQGEGPPRGHRSAELSSG